eukprot:TRINITY_DN7222_c0_g1_i2.p1 TRINITY_DN7222_c0_g1~~TRINITY_DN7222_c0_g1_i2.p1  ORF type:complete len:123 (+),score=21.15 TRINITY_DN7222_c0_g1_i2:54-371(+)
MASKMAGLLADLKDRTETARRGAAQRRGAEPSMKQVACTFGGLFAFIYLLQFFSFFTLMFLAVAAYFLFPLVASAYQLVEERRLEGQPQPPSKQKMSKGSSKAKR